MKVLLVNANLIQIPRIAPYAIDILASSLTDDGHEVAVCDLASQAAFMEEAENRLAASVSDVRPDVVAITLRNSSDLIFPSLTDLPTYGSFVQDHARIIACVKRLVGPERIVVGGSGFSCNPEQLIRHFGLHFGVRGLGEEAIRGLMKRIRCHRAEVGPVIVDGRRDQPYAKVRRTFVDNAWYYRAGGLGAVRTSNGCGMRCTYCVEPFAKGPAFRVRNEEDAVREIDQLVDMGIRDIHSADSEFSLPLPHAKRVLRTIIDRHYPRDLRFWLYCQPHPFDEELAKLMGQANVAGINFGSDHTDPEILRSVGKWFTRDHIAQATRLCHDHGIAVMHVLLFGSRGDTPDKMYRAIDEVWAMKPRVIGTLIGLAVLPGTKLAEEFLSVDEADRARSGYYLPPDGKPFIDPVFYADPAFRIPEIYHDLRRFVGERITNIMVTGSKSTSSETGQIVGSKRVAQQLASGIRGAYWYHYPDLVSGA